MVKKKSKYPTKKEQKLLRGTYADTEHNPFFLSKKAENGSKKVKKICSSKTKKDLISLGKGLKKQFIKEKDFGEAKITQKVIDVIENKF